MGSDAALAEQREAWAALEKVLRWSDSFVVVYVFAATPKQARALAARLGRYMDPAALMLREASEPSELDRWSRELTPLLEEHSRPVSHYERTLLWIDGSLEFEHDEDGRWRQAWVQLIGRLNERRELMHASLRGLILVAPPQAKPVLRLAGPDLWSIRAHAIEFSLPRLDVPAPASPVPGEGDPGQARALRRTLAAIGTGDVHDEVSRGRLERLKLSTRLARAEASPEPLRATEAELESALAELDLNASDASAMPRLRLELLRVCLDRAEVALQLGAHGESDRSLRCFEQALADDLASDRAATLQAEARVLAGELALATGDAAAAEQAFASASRQLEALGLSDTSPFGDRITLGLARAHRRLGALDLAEQHYLRARRSLSQLRELGLLALERGDSEGAATHLRDALGLAESASLAERVGVRRELAAAYMNGSHWIAARDSLEAAHSLAPPGSLLASDCRRDLAVLRDAMTMTSASTMTIAKRSLVILHLSDLHFGPHSRFGRMRPQQIADLFGLAIERHRIEAGLRKIDMVVVSGDLTEYADDEQFDAALGFCEALNGHFALGRERWAFVPGNHDLSWAYIELARVEQKIHKFDDEELERRIREYKFRNYTAFVDKFYERFVDDLQRVALSPAGWVQDIPELRVSVGLINSSEATTDRAKAGKLSSRQAQALLDHWRVRHDERLRILVVHHNPQEVDEASRNAAVAQFKQLAADRELEPEAIEHFVADTFGLEGKDLLERLAKQAQVPLLLHGHVHATPHRSWEWPDGERRTHVLAAGSAGAAASQLPGDQPNSVQLISIDLEDGRGQVLRLRYAPRAEEPGRIEPGTFVREADELGGAQRLRLALPAAFLAERERPRQVVSTGEDVGRGFLKEYRARLSGRFETWELGTRQRGTRQPAVVTLDDMYVPLRIDAGYDQEKFEVGRPIDVDELLARERGLIVRGGPGAGKTTWLRWLFRRMVEREDVLPIFVELRALAHRWAKLAPSEPHNLEGYLLFWLAEKVGSGWEQPFQAALGGSSPRPVLLIDGWDELGDLGREFGQQLVSLAERRPHVLIVATSRPYGEGVSELKVRFDEMQLQPMSDVEVATFVRNFYERVHRSEQEEVGEHVDRFLANLAVNPQARNLGRTPLLLVLLLIIGRDRPLPDRRHELYRMCIEDLLDARPKQRQAMGALQGSWEWAPEYYEQRLQAVAKLAFGVQSRHLETEHHERGRDALATREQLCAELGQWDPHRRDEFVTWLVCGAGLLIERDDGKLQFAHLGFQEYLSAWHLDATHGATDVRLERFAEYASNVEWWEVLRLWAALIEGRSPDSLAEVACGLMGSTAGYWLVGAMLADGLGERVIQGWLRGLGGHFGPEEYSLANSSAVAWKMCQQHERRRGIAGCLSAEVPGWTWMWRQRADAWRETAGIEDPLPPPPAGTPAGWIMSALEQGPLASERHFAWGRVWMSTSPFWGGNIEMLGLRLWPTRRSWIGWAIQSALGAGMGREQVLRTRWYRLLRDVHTAVNTRTIAGFVPIGMAMGMTKSAATDIMINIEMDIARYFPMGISMPMSMGIGRTIAMSFAGYLPRFLTKDSGQGIAMRIGRSIVTDIGGFFAKDIVMEMAKSITMDLTVSTTQDLATWITFSAGFAGPRTVFAHSKDTDPLTDLLRTACRHSLNPNLGPLPPTTFSGDPLWPALARHVARSSTPADRAYLEALVREPARAPEPLRWGLRYYVRSDVMFEDGSIVDLDEIWAGLREQFPEDAEQLRDLPYLDDMPPDVEIDRDAIERDLADRESQMTGTDPDPSG